MAYCRVLFVLILLNMLKRSNIILGSKKVYVFIVLTVVFMFITKVSAHCVSFKEKITALASDMAWKPQQI